MTTTYKEKKIGRSPVNWLIQAQINIEEKGLENEKWMDGVAWRKGCERRPLASFISRSI